MKRLLLSTALVMAVGVAVGGVYLDTSTVKQQARQLQVRRFTLQDIDRVVYGPDGLTNPQLKSHQSRTRSFSRCRAMPTGDSSSVGTIQSSLW
jgi:hypothetical protein